MALKIIEGHWYEVNGEKIQAIYSDVITNDTFIFYYIKNGEMLSMFIITNKVKYIDPNEYPEYYI